MADIRIGSIEYYKPEVNSNFKFTVENPKPGQVVKSDSLEVNGWALALKPRISKIDLVVDGNKRLGTKINLPRPDVYEFYPQYNDRHSGFSALVNSVVLSTSFDLDIVACFVNGYQSIIARIEGRRETFSCDYQPRFSPIILNCIRGRIGTTLVSARP